MIFSLNALYVACRYWPTSTALYWKASVGRRNRAAQSRRAAASIVLFVAISLTIIVKELFIKYMQLNGHFFLVRQTDLSTSAVQRILSRSNGRFGRINPNIRRHMHVSAYLSKACNIAILSIDLFSLAILHRATK